MVGVAMGGVCIGKAHRIRIVLFQLSSMYMYTHLHTHTHMHIYTHAHTHTHMLPELLRCFAESKLLSMVQMLFSCLHTLSEEAWGGGDDVCSVDQTLHCEEGTGEEQNHVTTEGDDENKGTAPEAPPTEEGEEETKQTGEEELDPPPLDAPPTSSLSRVPEKHRSVAPPYGLPCVRELLDSSSP